MARGASLISALLLAATKTSALRLRLANEAPGNGFLSVLGERVVLVPTGGVSAYVDVQATGKFNVSAYTDEQSVRDDLIVDTSVAGATNAATVLIAVGLDNNLHGTIVWDADSLLGPGNIDVCRLRVLNANPTPVLVSWGSVECVTCLRLPAFQSAVPFLGSGPDTGYATVPCAFATEVILRVASKPDTSIVATLIEHGASCGRQS